MNTAQTILLALQIIAQSGPSLASLVASVKPLLSGHDQKALQDAYEAAVKASDAAFAATDEALSHIAKG